MLKPMILVTGATGFVGRRVVSELSARGFQVRALVRRESKVPVSVDRNAELVIGDILNAETLRNACEGADCVVHLAAIIREPGNRTFNQVNYRGTVNVLQAAEDAGVRRIVHASAIGANPDPGIPYTYSRWMAEQEVQRSSMAHTILRFSVGFGEGDEFFNILAAQAKILPVLLVVGNGLAKFQPIAVEDMARCLVIAVENSKEELEDQLIEAGGPDHYTYNEILDCIAETLGVKIAKVHVPIQLMQPAIRILKNIAPRFPATTEQITMLNIANIVSRDSVRGVFGFEPSALRNNLSYLQKISLLDAIKIIIGFMPHPIRDH